MEALRHAMWRRCRSWTGKFNNVVLYKHAQRFFLDSFKEVPDAYPCVIPNWDNTARSNVRGVVLHESTPERFRAHLREAIDSVKDREFSQRLTFVKSWNEWAEGNYLEPDQRYGHGYLKVVREEVFARDGASAERPVQTSTLVPA
jgi:hypothetical protein